MRRSRAVITVFFSLLSILFLSLMFTCAEAVRYRSARAHCANLTAVGSWSVFSGFENRLLEKFDVFGIHSAGGGTSLSIAKLNESLKSWMNENADVRGSISEKLPGLTFDPFQVTAQSTEITSYALLSDNRGEYFYQQAVDFMHETAWMNALGKLSDASKSAKDAQEALKTYEQSKKDADKKAKQLREKTKQLEETLKADSDSGSSLAGSVVIIGPDGPASVGSSPGGLSASQQQMKAEKEKASRVKNPLWKMIALSWKNVLPLVCGDLNISSGKLPGKELLSKRRKESGTLDLDRKRGGAADNLLFREYLLDHFPRWHSDEPAARLKYQIEYLIGGTASDSKNLKKTVNRLILLREAYNYLHLQKDPKALKETSTLAALFLGWTGNAALIESFRELLIIYWAYGESLYDVRILMHKGKVPLIKTAADWHVPLSQLHDLPSQLEKADRTAGKGLAYADYLRLLLNMQSVKVQKERALDLLELNLQSEEGCETFRADACVIAMKNVCTFRIRPVFSAVPKAFLGTGYSGGEIRIEGGFAY
ncbi:MAG: DUF5702 domain-containing protein [Lachnospiraceae bacterium]|nr:DUF5702 domain-containing protein [Lachnospiraceae bacterium]MCI7093619.1 DUF5702 domain-containing protein [Lachnospiraceae bacterium]